MIVRETLWFLVLGFGGLGFWVLGVLGVLGLGFRV